MANPIAVNSKTQNEDELLKCCCRVSPGPEVLARIGKLVQEPLDWSLVAERSWWHRIRPLTCKYLNSQPSGLVPDDVLQDLGEHVTELSERNQRLLNGLHDVAAIFEEAKLRLLVFKGPALAIDAYGDLSLRECGDLDLLLHRDDFEPAAKLLESHGFKCCWDRAEGATVRQVFACEFDRDGVRLDVHWDLAPGWFNYKVDFDQFCDAGVPLTPQSHFVKKIRPEDSIVVLCIHGAKHWWERLRWIGDIAELINSGQIKDWNRVEAEAAKAHSRRSVFLGLWLAGNLLGAKLPAEVRQKLERQKYVRKLGTQIAAWLTYAEGAAEERSLKDRFLFRMGLCERWRDRVPQIWHYLRARPSNAE